MFGLIRFSPPWLNPIGFLTPFPGHDFVQDRHNALRERGIQQANLQQERNRIRREIQEAETQIELARESMAEVVRSTEVCRVMWFSARL